KDFLLELDDKSHRLYGVSQLKETGKYGLICIASVWNVGYIQRKLSLVNVC
ncbi:32725_t:CDS:1, partial [Gigaspora margarita]